MYIGGVSESDSTSIMSSGEEIVFTQEIIIYAGNYYLLGGWGQPASCFLARKFIFTSEIILYLVVDVNYSLLGCRLSV